MLLKALAILLNIIFFLKELNMIFQEISLDIEAVPLQAIIEDLYVE